MTRDQLVARISSFVRSSASGAPTEPFGDLALAIASWQAERSPVLRALSEEPPRDWRDIPAVPVALFRDLPVGTVRVDEPCVAFRTSGTTGGRGVHRMRGTELYDLGALEWTRRCVPDAPGDVAALLADPARAPDSSLSHMVGLFPQLADPPGRGTWHLEGGQVQRRALDERIRGASAPLWLATTAFALDAWLAEPVPTLPAGSVLMVTGGFKGRSTRLDAAALHRAAAEALRPARQVTEYGMTELSSQLWGRPGTPYAPPPWLRVWAVDPRTGRERSPGTPGQLRFTDLCNLDAAVSIETLDEGRVFADGTVELLGRLAGARARGCSLTVEEAWGQEVR